MIVFNKNTTYVIFTDTHTTQETTKSNNKEMAQFTGEDRLDWNEIESLVNTLCTKIKKTGFKFEQIATVSRGGLVPSRLVADRFNIKKILVDMEKIPQNTLFVDDIYDTGNTFEKIMPRIINPEDFVYATLVARIGKKYPKQLIYAKMTVGNEYVVFPWDRLEHERKQIK